MRVYLINVTKHAPPFHTPPPHPTQPRPPPHHSPSSSPSFPSRQLLTRRSFQENNKEIQTKAKGKLLEIILFSVGTFSVRTLAAEGTGFDTCFLAGHEALHYMLLAKIHISSKTILQILKYMYWASSWCNLVCSANLFNECGRMHRRNLNWFVWKSV